MIFGRLPSGQEFRLQFQHGGKSHRWTKCSVEFLDAEGAEPVSYCSGQVWCHSEDRFSKAEGRRHALANTLNQPVVNLASPGVPDLLTKPQRTAIWNAYHARVK